MSTDNEPWGEGELPPAALPIIRKEAAPRRVMAPIEEPEDEEDDGSGLWVEDEPSAWGDQADSSVDLDPLAGQAAGSAYDDDAEQDLPDPESLFLQMQAAGDRASEELPDPDALFRQMQSAGAGTASEELPDPDALFLQMQAQGSQAAAEDLPDPNALFLQMQAQAQAAEDLPDAEALFRQMQLQSGAAEEDLPDPDALFLRMQSQRAVQDDDLPDPNALFLQMRGGDDEEDLPDPNALFLQMQSQRTAEDDDLPDPDSLFLKMQGAGEELPDSSALFLRMRASQDEEEELPDPNALFLKMQSAHTAEDDLPDPNALFLKMQGDDIEAPSLLKMRPRESDEALLSLAPLQDYADTPGLSLVSPVRDLPTEDLPAGLLPDPDALLVKREPIVSEALPSIEVPLPPPILPELTSRQRITPDLMPLGQEATDSVVDDNLPDSNAIFRQMQSKAAAATPPALAGFDTLFPESGRETGPAADDLPDPEALFQQMKAQSAPQAPDPLGDDLPDPNALFLQMQAREAVSLPPDNDDLPDPNALFLQMQANLPPESAYVETGNEWLPPLPEPEVASPRAFIDEKVEEKTGLFSRLKAKFRGDKKAESAPRAPEPLGPVVGATAAGVAGVGAALPDPAELFRRMQSEEEEPSELPSPNELFRRLKTGELDHPVVETPTGLPALPDLDALRAEMEAEERANLDADLLGDLSGPERFADTVSDLAFNTGTFFQAPTEPSSLHKPPDRRQEKTPSNTATGRQASGMPPDAEPLPAMLAKPPSVSKPQVPASPRPPESRPPAPKPISYQPAVSTGAVPTRRKSASTAIMPKEDSATVAQRRAKLAERLAKFRAKRKSLSRHTLSVITRQMSAMLKAGISLHQCVSFCAESDPEAAPVLNDVCDKIGAGFSFSGALKEYPETFDAVYVGLVHAGELSGRLTEMLNKLADILERELDLRKRMISVVTYPAVLMAVSMLGTLGFIFFVLPQLTPMFLDLKVDLPWPTKILLSLRTILLPVTVVLTLAGVTLLAMKSKIYAFVHSRPSLERRLAYFPLSVPVIGPVYDKMITARVLYSLATMLEVGVTMNQALARAEGTSGNAYVGYRLMRARMDLAEGCSVTECFQVNQVFPETALQLIAAGEESARLVDMFSYIARHFDEEVEQAMTAAAGLLEPLIMVVMGLIVGFITIAAALPTIKLLQGF